MTSDTTRRKVAAVDRALLIPAAFKRGEASLSLAELAKRTKLHKSTILRLAASLEDAGYLVRLEDGRWRLGSTLSRLGALYQAAFNLGDYVEPALQWAADRSGESTAFYVKDDNVRVCLYRVESAQSVRHHIMVGEHLPLNIGGPGRVLTAFTGGTDPTSDEVRERYYYVSRGERDPSAYGVSVPVFDLRNLVGALGIIGPAPRFTEEAIDNYIDLALEAGIRLTGQLGGRADEMRRVLEARRGQPVIASGGFA
ncbi:IclR family transcriptional regulator [Acuticoccus kandeliae]|uniref:IclR family transcriptional regulator n=1 Tax=Acuticoccus kandeliae TaxID=2073160 RepID=UPI000D3ED2A9|nr:IclR family transcriptional regulator [Acuticoccus kandeliae]